ncbi:hypothetical protein F4678DRAFT_419567 [Xylaria arbuscula]|nr:hypothetical protein F4678DRAFT_419567 [Xylaria arbuscula]
MIWLRTRTMRLWVALAYHRHVSEQGGARRSLPTSSASATVAVLVYRGRRAHRCTASAVPRPSQRRMRLRPFALATVIEKLELV